MLLCFGIGLLFYSLPNNVILDSINSHKALLITLAIITVAIAIPLGVIGGKAGYKYVEMGRSRHWNYRSTAYSRSDDRFRNTLYWAVEFALYPINLYLIVAIVVCFNILSASSNF